MMREHIINTLAVVGAAFIGLMVSGILDCVVEDFKEKRKRRCSICGKLYKFGDRYCSNCGNRLGR